ncbi:MAG: iron reductase, partial [Bacillus sp. (in: firmicutes)]
MSWIWILIRVTGLTAYVLLTLSILAGIIKYIPGKQWRILEFHQAIGQVALVTIGIHAALLIFDQYEPYTIE